MPSIDLERRVAGTSLAMKRHECFSNKILLDRKERMMEGAVFRTQDSPQWAYTATPFKARLHLQAGRV